MSTGNTYQNNVTGSVTLTTPVKGTIISAYTTIIGTGTGDAFDRLDNYNAIQDSSILINTINIAQHDASIIRIDDYRAIQDVSIAALGGEEVTTKTYVDGSLGQRDASLFVLFTENDIQDSSILYNLEQTIRIDAYNAIQDASVLAEITRIDIYASVQDASILLNTQNIAQLDASVIRIDSYNAIQDASVLAEITRIDNYQAIQDASTLAEVNRIDTYNSIQDASILVGLQSSQYDPIQDVSIAQHDASIVRIDQYTAIQDASIFIGLQASNYDPIQDVSIAQLDASVSRIDAYNIIQDASILAKAALLSELDDVSIVSISDDNVLVYDASDSLWKNAVDIDASFYNVVDASEYFWILADTSVSNPLDRQGFLYDASWGLWRNWDIVDVSIYGVVDASEYFWILQDTSIIDASNGDLLVWDSSFGKWFNSRNIEVIDEYTAIQDTSIAQALQSGTYDPIQDASIAQLETDVTRIDGYNAIQDSSINQALQSGAYDPIQDASIAQLDASVIRIDGYNTIQDSSIEQALQSGAYDPIQDASIIANEDNIAQIDASVVRIDAFLLNPTFQNDINLDGSIVFDASGNIVNVGHIDFWNSNGDPDHLEGRVFYDSTEKALTYMNDQTDMRLQVGQEMVVRVRNNQGFLIDDGSVVKISGATGNRPTIELANSDIHTPTAISENHILGLATHDIANNTDGFVTVFGLVSNQNTSAFSEGDILYVDASVAGNLTNDAPPAPYDKIKIGTVTVAHATQGKIFVSPKEPVHFSDISGLDDSSTAVANGALWVYDDSSMYWYTSDQLPTRVSALEAYNTIQDASINAANLLGGLDDVSIVTPSQNHIILYDASDSIWENGIGFNTDSYQVVEASTYFWILQDTSVSNKQNDDVLVYDSSWGYWINQNISDFLNDQASTQDASIVILRADIAQLDASVIRIDGYNAIQDASVLSEFGRIDTYNAIQDSSIDTNASNISTNTSDISNIESEQNVQNIAISDNALDISTNQFNNDQEFSSIDTYQGIQDASILLGLSSGTYDPIQDASIIANEESITRIDAYNAIQDASIELAAQSGTYDPIQDASIIALEGDITRIDAYNAIQDASIELAAQSGTYDPIQDASIITNEGNISTNTSNIAQLDASVVRIDGYNAIQDSSINQALQSGAYDPIQDASIIANEAEIAQLDASIIRIDATNDTQDNEIATLDSSIVRIDAYNAIQDASISDNDAQIAQLDASVVRIDGELTTLDNYNAIQDSAIVSNSNAITTINAYQAIQDVSIANAGVTLEYVDGSLGARDVSIANNAASIVNIDSSISDLDTLTQGHTIDIANLDSSVAALDVLTQVHTADIAQLDASIIRIDATNDTQDNEIATLDSSIVRIDAYNAIQDASIISELIGLTDVSIISPVTDDILAYNSINAAWENSTTIVDACIGLLVDVSVADPSSYDLISYNETSAVWESGKIDTRSFTADTRDPFAILNGIMLDQPKVDVTSNGTTVTLNLFDNAGRDTIRIVYDKDVVYYDVINDGSLALTAGTDAAPQINYVYVPYNSATLEASTGDWPDVEYAAVATVLVQSAASVQTQGPYKVHAWTDHAKSGKDVGHIQDLNYWIRYQPATWRNGVDLTTTITVLGGLDRVDFSTTLGNCLQLHNHAFPVFDTSTLDSSIFVPNYPSDNYRPFTSVETAMQVDSGGNAIANNKWVNVILWGVVNEDNDDCKLMLNLPEAFHSSEANAKADAEHYSVYSIPEDFIGTAFYIAKIIFKYTTNNWELVETEDLRKFGKEYLQLN